MSLKMVTQFLELNKNTTMHIKVQTTKHTIKMYIVHVGTVIIMKLLVEVAENRLNCLLRKWPLQRSDYVFSVMNDVS